MDFNNNRLIALNLNSGPPAAQGNYEYLYDARTRRVLRDETAASGDATRLAFLGGTSVAEYDVADPIATATPQVEFVRANGMGGGVGSVLYSLRNNVLSSTHYNSRGDVTARADATGSFTYTAAYEAFGTHESETGTNPDRQQANTKEEDPTGLLNEGFRYRDLETGMFISRDPLGFVDGPNVYTYVRQNPWTMFDPLGLSNSDLNEARSIMRNPNRSFGESMRSMGLAFRGTFKEMNPFNGEGALREANQKFGEGVGQARQEINDAPIPSSLKSIAKLGLTVGSAGHSLNPLTMSSDTVEMGETVIEQGVGETARGIVAGTTEAFKEDPEYALMGLAAALISRKAPDGPGSEVLTSRAARREAMRREGIPTSQQPASQSRNASGREQTYEVPKPGGGTQTKTVQQQTMDRSHPGQGHWEAGKVKTDPLTGETRMNEHGRPKLTNDKSKVDYDE